MKGVKDGSLSGLSVKSDKLLIIFSYDFHSSDTINSYLIEDYKDENQQ